MALVFCKLIEKLDKLLKYKLLEANILVSVLGASKNTRNRYEKTTNPNALQ